MGSLSVAELQQALGDVLGVAWRRIDANGATHFLAQRSAEIIAEEQRA